MLSKDYENIIIKNDKFAEDTQIALGIVKKYVITNKLIIVGGMSIDFALRLKGDKLYEDDSQPDYDFYSPKYHADAYRIAEILLASGLKNISVINANHTSTMRVRVNYTVVADVTYMPLVIFEKLPTLIYRDVHVIHPHYQLIDQHRALSLPFENPPFEVILHRWKKDATRYDMLYNYYPLETREPLDDKKTIIQLKPEIKISSIYFKDQCIGGFAGLLYWIDLAQSYGFKEKINIGKIEVDSAGMVVEIPNDSHGVTVYTTDIDSLYKRIKSNFDIKQERSYNRFLDKLPAKKIIDNKWELFDSNGSMIGAHKLENSIYISNLQNIMLYMLTNLILLQNLNEESRGYSFYKGYIIAFNIVKWASDNFKKSTPKNKYSVFLPTIEVYGDKDISDSYLNSKRIFLEKINEQPKENLQPKLIFPETFVDGKIPASYYTFRPEKSSLLQFDGMEIYYNNK